MTPMLALSAVVVAIGALLFVFWGPIHRRLRTTIAAGPVRGGACLRRAAAAASRRPPAARPRASSTATCAATCGSCSPPRRRSWSGGSSRRARRRACRPASGDLRVGPAVVALVGLAGGVAAARARSLLAAMIAIGLAGLVAALTFMMNGAPDLALTQFAVESLVVVLLTVALLVLPLARAVDAHAARASAGRRAVGGVLGAAVRRAARHGRRAAADRSLRRSSARAATSEAFGRNVVNVILVDFRGFDTLGETTVIALSAIIAWSLLGPAASRGKSVPAKRGTQSARSSSRSPVRSSSGCCSRCRWWSCCAATTRSAAGSWAD